MPAAQSMSSGSSRTVRTQDGHMYHRRRPEGFRVTGENLAEVAPSTTPPPALASRPRATQPLGPGHTLGKVAQSVTRHSCRN